MCRKPLSAQKHTQITDPFIMGTKGGKGGGRGGERSKHKQRLDAFFLEELSNVPWGEGWNFTSHRKGFCPCLPANPLILGIHSSRWFGARDSGIHARHTMPLMMRGGLAKRRGSTVINGNLRPIARTLKGCLKSATWCPSLASSS
ncbi:hypothetical protein CDAR_67691 [Caerostris darwini]|uniref:Uncharacterized protein n=1 Tax=Caerostris darwini TaxID=1538125 RepID=A0AAV4TI94_9ARAC|nr:hypothetical protein CDAR_67691 [Caerostris darwini]